jgi:hypothetical protein
MHGLIRQSVMPWRAVAACVVAGLVLSACGGSTKTVTVVEVQHHPKPAVLRVPHTGEPSQCTVWLTDGSALVTFQGDGYPVSSTCNVWVTNSAKHGTLWTTQMPTDLTPYSDDAQICRLHGNNGWEYATVLDSATAGEGYGKASCEGLLATGQWTEMPAQDSPNYVPPKPPASPPPTPDSPVLKIGKWVGREPSLIGFSADAGNVVYNLRWTAWDKTQALGIGQSDIQTCIPSCATGGVMPVSAYVLLGHPVNGRFTRLAESQGGQITHDSQNTKTLTLAQMTTQHLGYWPWNVGSYRQALKEYRRALNGA